MGTKSKHVIRERTIRSVVIAQHLAVFAEVIVVRGLGGI